MANIYSVSRVNRYIKAMFDQDFALKSIRVTGEVSNCKYHSTGHIFFSLKDEGSLLKCVMYASSRSKGLSFGMSDGMKVVVTGRISVFERDGSYQMYAESITSAGIGELYQLFLEKKQEYEDMGLFAPEYKKPIPEFGYRIGVVTAPTGAVIHDIETTARNKNPYVQITLCPALVQGAGAAASIAKGIEYLDSLGLDCLIVGRGGGSIEDLWAFNEEVVVRAIFDANTPIISAVGHETDFTIADFVADHRAATPTAAAEKAVFDYANFQGILEGYQNSIYLKFYEAFSIRKSEASRLLYLLESRSPAARLLKFQKNVEQLQERMERKLDEALLRTRNRFHLDTQHLEEISPLKRLSQGYGYLMDDEYKKRITGIGDLNIGDTMHIFVSDGIIDAKVSQTKGANYGRK